MLAVCSPPAPGSGWSRTRAHEPPCDTQCSLTPTPHALHPNACLDVQATQSNHPSTSPPMVSCPYRPPSRATCRRAVHQGLHDEQGPAGLQDQHENWGEYTALPYPAPHQSTLQPRWHLTVVTLLRPLQIEMPMELHEDLAVLEVSSPSSSRRTTPTNLPLNYVAGYLPGGNDLVSVHR